MRSEELYRVLRQELGGWFKSRGFLRSKRGQLGWHKGRLFVWFQCDKWGWDPYAGSGFFVNLQMSGPPEPWGGPSERLQRFLSETELDEARTLQNRVISKLSPPPAAELSVLREAFAKTSPDPDALISALLREFEPVGQRYRPNQDFSLRYHDVDDVSQWAEFLLRVLPGILEKVGVA
jgi:hypothetical protein